MPMCQEVGRQSLTGWDHHRIVDGINRSWVKDHWGG